MDAENNQDCNCWQEKNRGLQERGYKIADICTTLKVDDLTLRAVHGFPLQRADGGKLKRNDPNLISISYCPFCGKPIEPKNKP